jgi:hypothetical protein
VKNLAHLKIDSPFYCVFEYGAAPIINIAIPSTVALEGSEETQAYMLDVSKCTQHQLEHIADILADRAGAKGWERREMKADAIRQMRERGLPIRASQVASVTTDRPFFL